jgi:hypothetical protein
MATWNEIADRFVHVLETGDADELERLYHPRLRFTVRTVGTALDRDAALAAFRRLWPLLCDVRVEIVDRSTRVRITGSLTQRLASRREVRGLNYAAHLQVRRWSGRRESNPRSQFGRLGLYH